MNFKVTPWFDGNVRPVYPGVYQRNYGYGGLKDPDIGYCLYDGKLWMVWGNTAERASKYSRNCYMQSLPWRGLANDPATNLV